MGGYHPFSARGTLIKLYLTKTMKKMMTTPSFRALIKGMIDNDAQATVRNLEEAHVGRKTQDRFFKVKTV